MVAQSAAQPATQPATWPVPPYPDNMGVGHGPEGLLDNGPQDLEADMEKDLDGHRLPHTADQVVHDHYYILYSRLQKRFQSGARQWRRLSNTLNVHQDIVVQCGLRTGVGLG